MFDFGIIFVNASRVAFCFGCKVSDFKNIFIASFCYGFCEITIPFSESETRGIFFLFFVCFVFVFVFSFACMFVLL